jgi:cysteinyl-tRNA synthetase
MDMVRGRITLYNTETRQKEEVVPLDGHTLRMYTCGPTVYNFAHIGNFRTYVFEDLLRRVLLFLGYSVRQVMNLTDIDDKTIKGAIETKTTLDAFTQPYKKAFFADLETLSIDKVEFYPEATGFVAEMIAIIQNLLEKGFAYKGVDGSIYYSIAKFPSYGRLSHLHLDTLKAGASERVFSDEYEKENVSDFVLWKSYDPQRDGDVMWDSPFGKGRPGWHIECSAMAMKLLGESIDIHVGGVDNCFPHHENEIAQSEAFSGKRFVRHWLHAEHLLVDHKKMSKSLGNFYTLRDLLKQGYTGRQIRYLLLQTHYRTQLNFTFQGLDAAAASLQRLADFITRLREIRKDKLSKALDLILDKALPDNPEKKQLHSRVLFDLKEEKTRDILDPAVLEPLLNRILFGQPDHKNLISNILREWKDEKHRALLGPILERSLHDLPEREHLMTNIVHDVRNTKDRDILNPEAMKPILHKAFTFLPDTHERVEGVLKEIHRREGDGSAYSALACAAAKFTENLADDLNISVALSALFDLVREVNGLCDAGKVSINEAEEILDFLTKIDQVLKVLPLTTEEEVLPEALVEALQKRERARQAKDWKLADACRAQIQEGGYEIEDTPSGARLKKVKGHT